MRSFNSFGNVSILELMKRALDLNDSWAVDDLHRTMPVYRDDDPETPGLLNLIGDVFMERYKEGHNSTDLETAISSYKRSLRLTPKLDTERGTRLADLGLALWERFQSTGCVPDIDGACLCYERCLLNEPAGTRRCSWLGDHGGILLERFGRTGNMSDLARAITVLQDVVGMAYEADRRTGLNNLGVALSTRFDYIGESSDLQAAIVACGSAVNRTPDNHTDKAGQLGNLGGSLMKRFKCLGDISDLEQAIGATRKAIDLTPDGHPDKASWFNNLGNSLQTRFGRLGDIQDREASICVFRAAAQSTSGPPHVKLTAARAWCRLAHFSDKQETLCAYDCAVSLIPLTAWMGTSIQDRYWQLEKVGDLIRDAAAAAARYGEPERALEWLEQGRSVVWGQTLNLRSPLDSLRDHHPLIAEHLTAVSHALDANTNDRDLTDYTRHDNHRALSLEWDQLISEVRSFDGFEDFLGSKKVSQLLPAASSFPIVVVNAHEAGCDALILIAGADGVIHIPLDFTSGKAELLLDSLEKVHYGRSPVRHTASLERLLQVTGSGAVPRNPNDRVRELLAELWCAIVKPVLDGLAFSLPGNKSDDLPRICWCPTGPLAFLPIHAAGDYTTETPGTKIFEFVVSSYTPTVTALLQPTLANPGNPKVLAVSQSKYTGRRVSALKDTTKEVKIICSRARAISIESVVLEDSDGTVPRVLDEMAKCNWIHLACHGSQDICDPTKSAFLLADGDLKLNEIIKHPLPHAEFAFLSDYTRAPYALHNAVHKLRSNGASFLAWMPFIHMGGPQPSLQAKTFDKRPEDGVARQPTVSESGPTQISTGGATNNGVSNVTSACSTHQLELPLTTIDDFTQTAPMEGVQTK